MRLEIKMEIIIGIVAFLVGGGTVFGVTKALEKKDPIVIQDNTAEKQQDVVLQLTDLDLVKEACSSTFIVDKEQGDILCRELFCRMQQRGVDAKTGATECEAISNAANKKMIFQFCTAAATHEVQPIPVELVEEVEGASNPQAKKDISFNEEDFKKCIELFDRRI